MTPMPRTRVIGTLVFCMTSSVIFAGGTPTPRASAIVDADFSGSWSLVSSTYAGRGQGRTGTIGVEREVKVSIASGAPVNCGTECTIAQNARALTITRPDQPGTTPPDIGVVVVNLDGRESTITQSNGAKYAAQAAWDDDQLVVTRTLGQSTVTQVLSVEDGQLRVVTTFSLSDAPVTLRYVRR